MGAGFDLYRTSVADYLKPPRQFGPYNCVYNSLPACPCINPRFSTLVLAIVFLSEPERTHLFRLLVFL